MRAAVIWRLEAGSILLIVTHGSCCTNMRPRALTIRRMASVLLLTFLLLPMGSRSMDADRKVTMKITRAPYNPIITPGMHDRIGTNINGPSLIKVPPWVENPLGRYYLYFSHHKGDHIRLAYADSLQGEWTIYGPGALSLEDSLFPVEPPSMDSFTQEQQKRFKAYRAAGFDILYAHIASPEAMIEPQIREIRLYYHGMLVDGTQATRVAVSADGLSFEAKPEVITRPYLRMFRWDGQFYGMAMPGVFYRSRDGLTGFEGGPQLFNSDMRHSALLVRDNTLYVFWTQVGDAPERLLLSRIDISADWTTWQESDPQEVLRPEETWEGADRPLEPSVRGAIETPVNQLRDPALFEEDGKVWLLYSVAGEYGIAISTLEIH